MSYLAMAQQALAEMKVPADSPDKEAPTKPPTDARSEPLAFIPKIEAERAEPAWLTWHEWKAAALNRLFLEQGVTGRPGRITAETIRHGEAARAAGEAPASKSIDPATGIRPISEWGPECGRGIARTVRAKPKKPRAARAGPNKNGGRRREMRRHETQ